MLVEVHQTPHRHTHLSIEQTGRPFGPSELVIVATGIENHHHQLFGLEIEPRFQESVAALERPQHEPAGVFHGLAFVLHDEV